jgi:anti-sigma regulatory factor (Ser/Thr protein kinase)
MQPQRAEATNGGRPSHVESVGARSELEGLRATCRRQAHAIDTLSEAVSVLRTGAAALKAENADLRAAGGRVRRGSGAHTHAGTGGGSERAIEVRLPLDAQAPAAARVVVTEALRGGGVAASAFDNARLAVSELVTNSVRHSGGSAAGVVVVRVQRMGTVVRLEVEDCGRGGVIAPRRPDLEGGGGFGLNLVQMLSERWGLERVAASGTRVWAQLPLIAPAAAGPSGVASDARSSRNGKPSSGRAAATRQRQPAEGSP